MRGFEGIGIMNNVEAVKEYRAAQDAAAGVRLANELWSVVNDALQAGEIDTFQAGTAALELGDVFAAAGEHDADKLERKAKRLRDRMVQANMPLVWKVAKRTLGSRSHNAANLEEAVQEGAIGLMRAVDEFDPSRGSFSTCAAYWIRHHVQNCMHHQVDFAKQRSACMPPTVVREVTKFRARYGREPEPQEIEYKGQKCTRDQWARWTDQAIAVSVHEEEASDTGEGRAELSDPNTSPELQFSGAVLHERFETAMAAMSPRNRAIARALFVDGRTLQDVADEFGITNQRVAQLKPEFQAVLRKVLAA